MRRERHLPSCPSARPGRGLAGRIERALPILNCLVLSIPVVQLAVELTSLMAFEVTLPEPSANVATLANPPAKSAPEPDAVEPPSPAASLELEDGASESAPQFPDSMLGYGF
jgi:hypothetical protein